mgnify:CR=1 FL=1
MFVERHMRVARQEMQEWRNWQTRRLQVPVVARSCGFKSHLLHYFFALRIKNWSGGPIRIALMGSVVKLFVRVFLFFQKRNFRNSTKIVEMFPWL